MSKLITLLLFLFFPKVYATGIIDSVLVDKSDARLYLIKSGKSIKSYKVSLGKNPVGHKVKRGDKRTPEGEYMLDWRNTNSKFYKSIHISYPSETDIQRALEASVDPGGMIMIHGQPNDISTEDSWLLEAHWTDGCIAVSNQAMDEIWSVVSYGTPIQIRP